MSQTRDQQRFTISEVAADWHEPMVPQCIMWPSMYHICHWYGTYRTWNHILNKLIGWSSDIINIIKSRSNLFCLDLSRSNLSCCRNVNNKQERLDLDLIILIIMKSYWLVKLNFLEANTCYVYLSSLQTLFDNAVVELLVAIVYCSNI